jgi:hypothetical protein
MKNIFFIPIFIFLFTAFKMDAQVALVDSMEIDTLGNTYYLFSDSDSPQGQLSILQFPEEGSVTPAAVVFNKKLIATLPYASTLCYMDDSIMLVQKYEKDASCLRLVKYSINSDKEISIQDSITLGMSEIARISHNRLLSKKPLVITTDDAVEGGGCTSVFKIYDKSLKEIYAIKPLRDVCLIESSVHIQGNVISMVGRDASNNDIFFSMVRYGEKIETLSTKWISLDDNLVFYDCFVIDGRLLVSCYEKPTTSEPVQDYYLLVFNSNGQKLKIIKWSKLITYVSKYDNNNYCFIDDRSNLVVDGKVHNKINGQRFLGNKTISTSSNKLYFYEIK